MRDPDVPNPVPRGREARRASGDRNGLLAHAARRPRTLWVPRTSSASCDQAVFVDHAADARVSSDTVLLKIDRFGEWFQRRSGVERPVRPVLIVMGLVLAQDPPQMVLIPDEGAVEKLAPASPDPAFGDRVPPGNSTVPMSCRSSVVKRLASIR
jgi:hypothetical protein